MKISVIVESFIYGFIFEIVYTHFLTEVFYIIYSSDKLCSNVFDIKKDFNRLIISIVITL